MTLELFLAKVNKVTSHYRHHSHVPKDAMLELIDAQLDFEKQMPTTTPEDTGSGDHALQLLDELESSVKGCAKEYYRTFDWQKQFAELRQAMAVTGNPALLSPGPIPEKVTLDTDRLYLLSQLTQHQRDMFALGMCYFPSYYHAAETRNGKQLNANDALELEALLKILAKYNLKCKVNNYLQVAGKNREGL